MKKIISLCKALKIQGKKAVPFIKRNLKNHPLQIFNTIGLKIAPFETSQSKSSFSLLNICFINDYFSQAAFLVKTKKYKNIIVAGDDPIAEKVFHFLQENVNIKVQFANSLNHLGLLRCLHPDQTYSNDPIHNANNFDAIFLFCKSNSSVHFINLITHSLEFNLDLILPANGCGWNKINRNTFGKPTFVCLFPFAGSNRFAPQWHYIIEKINYLAGKGYGPYLLNMRHVKKRKLNPKCSLDHIDQGLKEEIKYVDYFQYISMHEWTSLKTLANNSECNIVVLMRDPRDLANSCYWHYFGNSKKLMTERVLKGFNKFNNYVLAHNFTWPSIEDITDAYVLANEANNIFTIKFEDLITDPVPALKNLFSKIGMYPSIFRHLDDNIWQEAAHRGSFEYQTKGKLKEGKNNSSFYSKNTGLHRKGIAGDWKSSFTNEAVEYVKKVTKDGLIKLGYEKDMNWSL